MKARNETLDSTGRRGWAALVLGGCAGACRTALAVAAAAAIGAGTAKAASIFDPLNAVGTEGSGVTASASSFLVAGYEADNVVDWSGMSGTWPDGTHTSTRVPNMWHSDKAGIASQWLAFDFGSEKELVGFHYWNYNGPGSYEDFPRIGTGIKTMDIQTSTDGTTWVTQVSGVQLSQATGLDTYEGDDYELPSVLTTQYLRFKVNSNWNGVDDGYAGCAAFSEVVFYIKPPPATGTVILIR